MKKKLKLTFSFLVMAAMLCACGNGIGSEGTESTSKEEAAASENTENANIDLVKNGTLPSYPSKKIGEALDSFFFYGATWSTLNSDKYVYCSGECTKNGENVTATICFEVDGKNFELKSLSAGDKTYTETADINGFLDAVYYQ